MTEYFGLMLALFGAAFAWGMAGIGSAIGVGITGESVAGVLTEDPNKFVMCLILQAIPGTQGFYGFILFFMVLAKLQIFGTPIKPDWIQGLMIFVSCLPVALVCWYSAIAQGKAAAASVQMIARRPEEFGRAIILPAMVETYAVLSLLTSIILLTFGVKLG